MSISHLLDPATSNESWKNLYVNSLALSNPQTAYVVSPNSLNYYEEFDHLTTFGGALINTSALAILRITRVGNMVTIRIPQFNAIGTNVIGTMVMNTPLPLRFRPNAPVLVFPCPLLGINSTLSTGGNVVPNQGLSNDNYIQITSSGDISFLPYLAVGQKFMNNNGVNGNSERFCITYVLA